MGPSFAHSLDTLCKWLEQTSLSQAIQVNNWVVPTVQTVHILAIAVVASSALMIDLRLIGVLGTEQPLKVISARFSPFLWCALLVLMATGAIMIVGEPPRSLKNPAFQLKMSLLLLALAVTGILELLARSKMPFRMSPSGQRTATIAIAAVSLLLWSLIIFAGRWIAYYA